MIAAIIIIIWTGCDPIYIDGSQPDLDTEYQADGESAEIECQE